MSKPKKAILIRMTPEEAVRLAELAQETGYSQNAVMRQLIRHAEMVCKIRSRVGGEKNDDNDG